jgi:hypothetical protein
LQVLEAANEQAGPEQQQETQGDLRRDQPLAEQQRPAGPGDRTHGVLERRPRIRTAGLQCRQQAEHDAGEHGERDGEGEDAEVRGGGDEQRCSLVGHQCQQRSRQHRRQAEAGDPSDQREDQAFDQELPYQLAARGAERQAHGDLLLPHEAARDQQVGDVGAGDQQDQTHHRHQDDQRRREIVAEPGESKRRGFDDQVSGHEPFAGVWRPLFRPRQRHLVLTDLQEQPLQRRLRRGDRVSGLEPGEHLHPSRAAVVHVHPIPLGRHHRFHLDRHADLRRLRRIEAGESPRRHADDRHRVVVHQDLLTDDGAVAAEAVDPVVVAEHDDRMPAIHLIVFLGVEHPPEGRSDAEHREVVARDELGLDALGVVVDANRGRHQPPAQHLGERLTALLQVLIERVRVHAGAHVAPAVRSLLVEHDELVGILDRELAEEQLIEQREDGGIGPDAERE